jgi:DNA-binding transcriptional ArsR family regulator
MARLLPSTPDLSAADEADPRVIGLDSEDADDALAALSSGTARRILRELHDEPDSPASIADRVDTSLQNVQYHLSNLTDAGLVEVVDTVYSEKGREMKVYAPADRPLVVFAGREDQAEGLRSAVRRLLGAVGLTALASLLVQTVLEGFPFGARTGGAGGGGGSADGAMSTQATEAAAAAEAATGLPPGVLFFAGGLAVVLGTAAVRYVQARRA